MKYTILGGGGFLGGHLATALLAEDQTVRIFDRGAANENCALSKAEWIQGDFTDRKVVESALQGTEVVYHLISSTVPKTSNDDPAADVENNVSATLRMLDEARKSRIKKIIFVSSGGTVYGRPERIPIPETHSNAPLCSYGIQKLAIEKYLHLYYAIHGLDYCVLRLANPFGEGQRIENAQGAIAAFLYRAMHGQEIEIWGDGSVVRDYFYVSDAVRALLMARNSRSEHKVFNIGSGRGKSLNEVVAAIEKVIGRELPKRYLPGRAFDVPANVLSIERARSELQWEPQVSFEDGLRRTWLWMTTQNR